jgi:hypothetical protein
MDTFRITAYNATTQVVTVTVTLAARDGFAGGTYTGIKKAHPPTDTVANVKAWFREWADSYIAGVRQQTLAQAPVSAEVAALLNVTTSF